MSTITLNDKRLASLKATVGQRDYFDAALPGFGVRVSATGRKTFMLMHRVNGKLQRLTLRDPESDVSTYPTVTLAKARELARAALRASSTGHDPAAERKQARERTFQTLTEQYLEQHAKRKKRSWRDDARMIRRELAGWRDRPVASIRRADVRDVLEAIVTRGAPVLANRVLALVRKMFNFALEREWIEANVAAKMTRPAAERSRTRVLTADEIRVVWAWLERPAPEGERPVPDRERVIFQRHWTLNRAALKLRLITAQRGGEVIAMRWFDVDLESGWWTIPETVSKNKLPHRVPLSTSALSILRELREDGIDEQPDYVFAGIRGTTHRHGVLEGIGVTDLRPHDFRRTAASMMAAGGVPRLTISKILNHVETGVTAIYDRHSYDAEKRVALNWWALKLKAILDDKPAGAIVPFRRHAGKHVRAPAGASPTRADF